MLAYDMRSLFNILGVETLMALVKAEEEQDKSRLNSNQELRSRTLRFKLQVLIRSALPSSPMGTDGEQFA
jgi:hypothetical protein